MKNSVSFKIGKVEVCIIPAKLSEEERLLKRKECYRDLFRKSAIAVGLVSLFM